MTGNNARKLLNALTDVDDIYIKEASEFYKHGNGKVIKIAMRVLAAAACLVLALGFMLRFHPGDTGESVMTPNPYIEYATLQEAADIAGFDLQIPRLDEYEKAYYVIDEKIIEVTYSKNGDREFFIRKARGNEDISGDYNDYSENKNLQIGERNVLLKGDGGNFSLAVWSENDYTYAVTFDNPAGKEEIISIVNEVN